MLLLDDIHVHYGRVSALRGISLVVNKGELIAVIGPNGAGKSTTLLTVMGVVPPSSGRILLDGESINRRPPEAIVRRGISLVPEGRRIFGRLTVDENLQMGAASRRGIVPPEDLDRILGLFPVLRTYFRSQAGKLSGGEQQQLAIARALLARPRLLLLDEPSLGIAPIITDEIFRTLLALRTEGVTILLVEQLALRALEICDRAYVLRNGQISYEGTASTLLAEGALEGAYFGFEGTAKVPP